VSGPSVEICIAVQILNLAADEDVLWAQALAAGADPCTLALGEVADPEMETAT
jgi:hypothetical protein